MYTCSKKFIGAQFLGWSWLLKSPPPFNFNQFYFVSPYQTVFFFEFLHLIFISLLVHFFYRTSSSNTVWFPVNLFFFSFFVCLEEQLAKHDAFLGACPERGVIHWRSALISPSLCLLPFPTSSENTHTNTPCTQIKTGFRWELWSVDGWLSFIPTLTRVPSL